MAAAVTRSGRGRGLGDNDLGCLASSSRLTGTATASDSIQVGMLQRGGRQSVILHPSRSGVCCTRLPGLDAPFSSALSARHTRALLPLLPPALRATRLPAARC